uniref:Acylphosphatase n=1 Tax=Gadus morhua TaxID=8049 RepID=A0A8C5A9I8_GADMO
LKPYPLGKINLRCCFPRFTLRLNVHTMSCEDLLSVDYEVFGRVQGVFFRKFTQAEAKKLGLVGWVRNTEAGTVEGQLQGPGSKVAEMQTAPEQRGRGGDMRRGADGHEGVQGSGGGQRVRDGPG